ncbi:putative oxidoreductase [Dioszegia hungarica]|uniref:Oxidoreductase n=1 Tax=Dioszegia hungarica TaxID=4972 RepID=A0AA38LWJ1_9TREE|nr:putative oxidoreductase [Dioszegia hungarica]KAI9638370.1 putative oxidoreductase [Dioszegia hungarica]
MSSTVLITGTTAFLGAHVVERFLHAGWTVHATIRSSSKQPALESSPFFGPFIQSGKLKLFTVGDLTTANYSDAIKGCTAVVHVASPVEFTSNDFRKDYLAPAQEGTRSVVEAAIKEEGVKHIVMTSTYGAVGSHQDAPWKQVGTTFTEANWNPYTLEQLDEIAKTGVNTNPYFPPQSLYYMGAKKYAEITATELCDEARKKGRDISFAAMNCVIIAGPPIQPQDSLSQGGMSTEIFYALLGGKDAPIAPADFPYMVDVRDAAEAHYQAVVRDADGRFNLSGGPYSFQQVVDFLHQAYPAESHRVPVGTPGKYEYKDPGVYGFDSSKSTRELGIKYHTFEETMTAAYDRFLQLEKEGLK